MTRAKRWQSTGRVLRPELPRVLQIKQTQELSRMTLRQWQAHYGSLTGEAGHMRREPTSKF